MKKSIIILSAFLITCSLMAFGIIKLENQSSECKVIPACQKPANCQTVSVAACQAKPVFASAFPAALKYPKPVDIHYEISSRFLTTITKEKLEQATSILDIIPSHATESKMAFQNSRVYLLEKDHEIMEYGNSEVLTKAQINLLKSADYSTNIRLTSICKKKNHGVISLHNDSLVYYMTIVPEEQAEYTAGIESLISYLREKNKEHTAFITQDQLKAGRVNFTISKQGKVEKVYLASTCGFSAVDENLLNLIKNMPGKWIPAKNARGNKIDQELVFSFGIIGC